MLVGRRSPFLLGPGNFSGPFQGAIVVSPNPFWDHFSPTFDTWNPWNSKKHPITGWWQLKYFLFSPLFGEDEPILTNIFERGWNHQLDYLWGNRNGTLPETNMFASENGWLEDFLVSFWDGLLFFLTNKKGRTCFYILCIFFGWKKVAILHTNLLFFWRTLQLFVCWMRFHAYP